MKCKFFSYKVLSVVSILCLLQGCISPNYESYSHFETRKVEDVNIEIYISKSESTYTNDSYLYYLTDSISYRVFLGECSSNEYIDVKINEDEIEIYKNTKKDIVKESELIDLTKYSHNELKDAGQFDTHPNKEH